MVFSNQKKHGQHHPLEANYITNLRRSWEFLFKWGFLTVRESPERFGSRNYIVIWPRSSCFVGLQIMVCDQRLFAKALLQCMDGNLPGNPTFFKRYRWFVDISGNCFFLWIIWVVQSIYPPIFCGLLLKKGKGQVGEWERFPKKRQDITRTFWCRDGTGNGYPLQSICYLRPCPKTRNKSLICWFLFHCTIC